MVNLPLILGLAVAVFGAVTLRHFLLVSVARPRWQVGTPQGHRTPAAAIAAAITWQAETVAVVALVLGLLLGWRRAASPGTWPPPTSASQAS